METEIKEKKKKFVPDLRFQEFQDNWKEVRLGKICCTFKSGSNITSKDIFEEGLYPVYGGNGLRGFTNIFSHEGFYFLIGRQGALCGNINKVNGKIFISEHAIAVQTNSENDTEWLAQKLEYYNLNRLSESSAQPGLAVSKLERLKLKIPSLPEQQKIASFLSAVDKKIQKLTRKKELLETYKKGVMQKLFSQEIRFKDDVGNDFPEWESQKLKNRVSLIKDGTHGTHKDVSDSGFYLLSAKNILNGQIHIDQNDRQISKNEYHQIFKNFNLEKGDIFLSIVGTIGRSCVYKGEKNVAFQRSVAFFRFPKDDSEFVYQFFNSLNFQKELKKRQVVSAQPGIYLGDLSKIDLVFPTNIEQQKMANFLSAIDNKLEAVSQQIKKTQQFKKGLLQQMFV